MNDQFTVPGAVGHGEPRLDAAPDPAKFLLSVDDAIARYKAAGIFRIRRTVQRYCANGALDAHRVAVPYGEKWLITPESLDRHIKYILEAQAAVADRGRPRLDTADVAQKNPSDVGAEAATMSSVAAVASHGGPRQDAAIVAATAPLDQSEIVEMLKHENGFLKDQIAVKDAQLAVKDRQIADQSERTRETNLLVASLHKLITPLLGVGDKIRGSRDSDGSSLDESDIHQATGMSV